MRLIVPIAVVADRPEGSEIFASIVEVHVLSHMKNPKDMIEIK